MILGILGSDFVSVRSIEFTLICLVSICLLASTSGLAGQNDAIIPSHNLKRHPGGSNYQPEGREVVIGNLTVYESNDTSPTQLLFAAYDVMGFNPNTKFVADRIADAGFRVAMPDFFRGGWDIDDFPAANPEDFQNFWSRNGSWANAKIDLQALITHYKSQGVTRFGIFGFCWGAKVAVLATTELFDILASGLIHPTMVTNTEAYIVNFPSYVLPSRDEQDMLPFYNVISQRFGPENSGHRRFDDMRHGFAGAGGNFEDPLNKARVDEVIQILQKYFNQQLNKPF